MKTQYLLKLIQSGLQTRPVDASVDVFALRGIVLGGVLFDESNLVTVSGTNSLTAALAAVSGQAAGDSSALLARINAVSGASSARDDLQDLQLQSSVAGLNALISSVSGASSRRDDLQDLTIQSVSAYLYGQIGAVSGASSARDDRQDLTVSSVSGSLQAQITAIVTDEAKEERLVAAPGQNLFTVSTFAFNPSNSIRDIVVYKNASRLYQSSSGLLSGGDFKKVGTNQIQILYNLQDGDRLIVRDERTGGTGSGGGGGGGGSTDLTNILVDISPAMAGQRSVGTGVQPWKAVYLQDAATSAVWQLQVVSGSLQIVQV